MWAQFEPEMFAHHEDRIAAAIEARYGIDIHSEAEELARERNVERDDETGPAS